MGDDSSPEIAASALEGEDEDPSVTAVADEAAVTREHAPDIAPGDLLAGRYQVEAVIGKGGSGIVVRAFDRVSATVVAVKVLKPGLTHDPRWEKRFQRELRLGRPVRHPNVCRIFDIGDADGYRFLTMEYATGGTLRDLVKKKAPLPPLEERLADAAGVIDGLAAIHAAGIVHRDVKPDNVLRMEDGHLVLSDFGLATDLPESTMVSVFVGTPHYMAPEVREGDPATTRSDVWSLGVVLHEVFFGRRPDKRLARSASGVPKSTVPTTSSIIERAMLAVCENCLADDPADRPADAGVVATLFERARSTPHRALWRKSGFSRRPTVFAGLALCGLIAGALYGMVGAPKVASTVPNASLQPSGTPADWRTTARVLTTIPERVHCFSLINRDTARIVAGHPRHAEDVDLKSGARRDAGLLPETYKTGCPQISPDGKSLLFDAVNASGATEIRLSNQPGGGVAKTITPGAEPVWLRNGQEFLYSLDPSHAAVFSLPTMTFILLSDPGLGGHQMIADKAASFSSDTLALLLVDENAEWAAAVYEGRAFDRRVTYHVPAAQYVHFDSHSGDLLLPHNQSASLSTLTSLDWRIGRLKHLGQYPGLEIVNVQNLPDVTVVLGRHRSKDAWLIAGSERTRMTTDGQVLSAGISAAGDLLLSRRAPDGRLSIWRQRRDGGRRQITGGPSDTTPEFSPDGLHWTYVDYDKKSVMLCASRDDRCSPLRRDEMLPTWPRFSPDGAKIAYVTQMGTPRLAVVSLHNGKTKELGPMHYQCPPVWSSPGSIWSLEAAGMDYRWVEHDADNGEVTGKTIAIGEGRNVADGDCWPTANDARSPFFRHVQIETEERSILLGFDRLD
jgi:hypothetical protein